MLNAEMKEYKTRVGVIPSTSTHQPVPSTPQHTTVLSVVRTITMIQQQEQQQQPIDNRNFKVHLMGPMTI